MRKRIESEGAEPVVCCAAPVVSSLAGWANVTERGIAQYTTSTSQPVLDKLAVHIRICKQTQCVPHMPQALLDLWDFPVISAIPKANSQTAFTYHNSDVQQSL